MDKHQIRYLRYTGALRRMKVFRAGITVAAILSERSSS
jgi:hypothetical protein